MAENGSPMQADGTRDESGEAALDAEAQTAQGLDSEQKPPASGGDSPADEATPAPDDSDTEAVPAPDSSDGEPAPAPDGSGDERGTAVTDIIGVDSDDALDPTLSDGRHDATAAAPAGPAPEPARPKLSDVARVAGGYARTKGSDASSYLREHPRRVILVAVVALAAVLALVMLGIESTDLPSGDVMVQAVDECVPTPDSSGGYYGYDDPLPCDMVTIQAPRRSGSAPDGVTAVEGASAYATVDVLLTYSNEHIRVSQTATLVFAKVGGSWTATGDVLDESVAYTAREGVDESKALRNVGLLLDEADDGAASGSAGSSAGGDDAGEPSLASLYADGSFEVTAHAFDEDAQTDALTIACTASDGLARYTCTLEASFRFLAATGTWEVADAQVSADARTRSLAALEGGWTGAFVSQESGGTKCLAANANPLALVVTDASTPDGDAALLVNVTSALAHFHAYPRADAPGCDGDTVLADVSLTCALADEADDGSLTFTGTLPDQAGGVCTLELAFDVDSGASATLTTRHSYTEEFLLVFPYQSTATYADAYTLTHAS